ncbi:pilus assembly protein PilA [Achromatium sp. WMS3]|nr:pilus assembly protein PilA [Achromatium sp. WMS3]
MRKLQIGFTLIELMVVVAIIGILSVMAVPTYQNRVIRTQIQEAMGLADSIKQSITEAYKEHKSFPANNLTAGVPEPKYLIGNFVTSIQVQEGAIHITLGNKINANAANKILTIRPATVTNSPNSPISWLCGYSKPVPGMQAVSTNKTNLPRMFLSYKCR